MHGNKGNRTAQRGRGKAPKRIVINTAEGAALRKLLAKRHGYSAEEAFAGLLSGELATVLLDPDDRARIAAWLETVGPTHPDVLLRDSIASLARQLRQTND